MRVTSKTRVARGVRASETDACRTKVAVGFTALYRSLFVVGTAVLLAGCGPGNPLGRLPISGEVTLDDAPVVLGTIQFDPVDSRGVGTGTRIDNGDFSIDTQHGLPRGRYLVRIYYPEPPAEDVSGPPGPDVGSRPARELIPPAYNEDSEQFMEVTAEGENRFTFQIESE